MQASNPDMGRHETKSDTSIELGRPTPTPLIMPNSKDTGNVAPGGLAQSATQSDGQYRKFIPKRISIHLILSL